jgi:acyl-homoserine lactone acylase PvdQ
MAGFESHDNRSYNALLESWLITKANNLAEYKKAMDLAIIRNNNTVYADDKGNIVFGTAILCPNATRNWIGHNR